MIQSTDKIQNGGNVCKGTNSSRTQTFTTDNRQCDTYCLLHYWTLDKGKARKRW